MKYLKVHYIASGLLLAGVVLGLWYLWFGQYFEGNILIPDADKAGKIQPFFAGLVVPLLTLGSALLVYGNFRNTAKQNFSSNFFKLIEMHHKLRDTMCEEIIQISDTANPSKSKDIFDDLCLRIYYDFNGENTVADIKEEDKKPSDPPKYNPKAIAYTNGKAGLDKLSALYDYYFHVHHSSLGHYFRNLYYLVKYADNSPFSTNFKEEHLRILRAQLSNYELLLLAYNCLHDYGRSFYPLVEKYELLKSLNSEVRLADDFDKRIIDIEILKNAYPHLKKYFTLEKDNKTVGEIKYYWKNVSLFKKTISIFSYTPSGAKN